MNEAEHKNRAAHTEQLTDEEQHRKAWLHHALQTPAPSPYRKTTKETFLATILKSLINGS